MKAWNVREALLHPFHLQRTATAMSLQDCNLELEDFETALTFARRVCTSYDCIHSITYVVSCCNDIP